MSVFSNNVYELLFDPLIIYYTYYYYYNYKYNATSIEFQFLKHCACIWSSLGDIPEYPGNLIVGRFVLYTYDKT